jgi:SAM-dependent methyltransferase
MAGPIRHVLTCGSGRRPVEPGRPTAYCGPRGGRARANLINIYTMKPQLENGIYRARFSQEELAVARAFWSPICRYLQRYVDARGVTLDLGAGYCHFINQIASGKKLALDVNVENLRLYAGAGVRCIEASGANLAGIGSASVDSVFASNVYEHFPSREDVAASLEEVYRVLRPGGRLIILQPNFAYCAKRYFDYFDHRLIFTHKGMVEGLTIAGFQLERVTARFLPYTSKSALPAAPWLVSAYLAFPPAWRLLGHQMLLVAAKPRIHTGSSNLG